MTVNASNEFKALPTTIKVRVLAIFEALKNWPAVSGCKPLTADWVGHFRKRTGDYRIIFSVDEDKEIILIVKIGHRKDIY